jgi:1,4-dihydroxy-2-naphthoate octaprenyltransferase
MITFLITFFLVSMVLATGAVEADNYLIGFVFVILGILSGVIAIFYQNKKESKNKQLYYEELRY